MIEFATILSNYHSVHFFGKSDIVTAESRNDLNEKLVILWLQLLKF